MRLTLMALIIGIALTGCGLKGPLYLPSKAPAHKPAATTPAPSDKSDRHDND